MTYLLIMLASSSVPSQIPHTLFDIISFSGDVVYVKRRTHDTFSHLLHGNEFVSDVEVLSKLYSLVNSFLNDEWRLTYVKQS